jgi:hypothetical protein
MPRSYKRTKGRPAPPFHRLLGELLQFELERNGGTVIQIDFVGIGIARNQVAGGKPETQGPSGLLTRSAHSRAKNAREWGPTARVRLTTVGMTVIFMGTETVRTDS